MYLCTRQIDIHARFGIQRIAFMSIVATIITFLVSYEIMYYFSDTPLSDRHFIILLIFIILMYPIHKIMHLVFFLPFYKSFRVHKLVKRNGCYILIRMLIRLSIKYILYKFNFTYIIINWHFCSVKYSSTSIWSLFYVFIIIKYWLFYDGYFIFENLTFLK